MASYRLKTQKGRKGAEGEKKRERMDELDELIQERDLILGEARALKAKEEINHRDNERIIHKLAFEIPDESFFLSLRTTRSPFEDGRKYSYSQGFGISICAAATRRRFFRVEISSVRNIEVCELVRAHPGQAEHHELSA